MTTVYYSDSTPPTAPASLTGNQPTLTVGLAGTLAATGDSATFNYISYYLYSDTTTFTDWLTWADYNKLSTNVNNYDYDGTYVLNMIGEWPQLESETDATRDDMMCIIDAVNEAPVDNSDGTKDEQGYGATCIVTDKANSAFKTYALSRSNFYTDLFAKLTAIADESDGDNGAAIDWNTVLAGFTYDSGLGLQDTSVNTVFSGFQAYDCSFATSVTMDCRAWSRAAFNQVTANSVTTNYGETEGFPRWGSDESVYFLWADGTATTTEEKFFPFATSMDINTWNQAPADGGQLHSLSFTGAEYLSMAAVGLATSIFAQLM